VTPTAASPAFPPANRTVPTANLAGTPAGTLAPSQPEAARRLPGRNDFDGAQIIARVGNEVIQAAEVVPAVHDALSRMLPAKADSVPEEEIDRAFRMLVRQRLEQLIDVKLFVNDAKKAIPEDALAKIEKEQNDQFDKEQLGKMLEQAGVGSRAELEAKLRKNGGSLDLTRRAWFESRLAGEWMRRQVKVDEQITHEQLVQYYQTHSAEFDVTPEARWEQLSALFENHSTPEEAFRLVATWGNDVLRGVAFAEVAKAHSEDSAAKSGGVHEWTAKGSLASEAIDEALFSLPVGQLSQIIEDQRGFHIVRVLERKDQTHRSFAEAQADIRKKVREERIKKARLSYRDELRKRTLVWTAFDDLPAEKESGVRNQGSGARTQRPGS
jgi:parvulin-like peptidyl-prolyl isomerase